MKTLRCISVKATGLLDVAIPQYGISFVDGEEKPVADDVAEHLLRTNPNFEAVDSKLEKPSSAPSKAVAESAGSASVSAAPSA